MFLARYVSRGIIYIVDLWSDPKKRLRRLLIASTIAINFKFNEFILNEIELSASCLS